MLPRPHGHDAGDRSRTRVLGGRGRSAGRRRSVGFPSTRAGHRLGRLNYSSFRFCQHSPTKGIQMERRTVLAGAAASAAGFLSGAASAADTAAVNPTSSDLAAALARFRASIPARFDRIYVENAVVPFFLTSLYE